MKKRDLYSVSEYYSHAFWAKYIYDVQDTQCQKRLSDINFLFG